MLVHQMFMLDIELLDIQRFELVDYDSFEAGKAFIVRVEGKHPGIKWLFCYHQVPVNVTEGVMR